MTRLTREYTAGLEVRMPSCSTKFLTSQIRMCLFFFRMRLPMGSQKQSKYPELAWENNFFLSLILAASTDDGGTK